MNKILNCFAAFATLASDRIPIGASNPPESPPSGPATSSFSDSHPGSPTAAACTNDFVEFIWWIKSLTLKIVVDDRETRSGMVDLLRRKGFDMAVQRLPVGDYVVDADVVVERKTVADFSASLKDHRLFAQAKRLRTTGLKPFLIMEGDWDPRRVLTDGRAGRSAQIALTLNFGIAVIRTANLSETADTLAYLSRRSLGLRCNFNYSKIRSRSPQRRKIQILCEVPGVGPKLAKSLIEKFDSLAGIALATDEQLLSVRGLGPERIESLREVLNEDPIPYNGK